METCKLSKTLIKRLPAYLNYLKNLPGEDCNISATTIARALGLGDVQVRKDLAKISQAGRRRTGRSRDQLIRDIEQHLNLASTASTVIVSSGDLGQLLTDHCCLKASGLNVMACFDPCLSEKRTDLGIPVYSMSRLESFCRYYDVRIGIIAVPPDAAQQACDGLVACGIQGIWNLSPANVTVPQGIALQSENFALSISALRMQMQEDNRVQ